MIDKDKTKEQLIDDLAEMRRRNAELEESRAELKQMYEALEESEERYRDLLENSNDLVQSAAPDGHFLYVNRAWRDTLGYSIEEVANLSLFDIIHPQSQARCRQVFQRVISGGSVDRVEATFVARDGREIIVEGSANCRFVDGKPFATRGVFRDITRRKQAEEEFVQREERYRTIFELSPEAIVLLDARGNILDVNGRLYDWLDYKPEEVIGKNILGLPYLPQESKTKALKKLSQRMAGEELPPYELDFVTRSGEKRIGRIVASPTRDETGRIVQDIIMISDITDQKKVEEELERHRTHLQELVEERTAELMKTNEELQREILERRQVERDLRESEERYTLATRAARVGVWDWDVEHEAFYLDPNVKAILGYSDQEIPNDLDAWATYVHPDDRQRAMEGFQAHLEGKIPEYVCEHRMLHKDGSIRWVSARGTAIRGVQGNITRVVGTDVDITDRKQVEEALRESEEKFMKAFKSSPNLVAITKVADGCIVDVNDSFIHASGYSREELIGVGTMELGLWTQPEKRDEFVEALQEDGQVHNMEVEIRTKSGEMRTVLLSGAIISLTGRGPHMITMANDITRWKQIEDQLLGAQKLESIGVLAGGIAHDFNNILTGILGNIYLARVYRDSDKVHERLEEAEKASLQAKELAQRLLTFSYGGAPIKKIANIVQLLESSASFALSGSNVRCEFSIPDDLWPLNIDKQQINQVIHNMVINADQAMPEGGTIRIIAENVTIEAESAVPLGSGDYVRISIRDQGVGIPEEDLGRVFDPYFSTKQIGSGLGLAISHSIIRSHSGLITVESQIGMGTTFHIYLPACLEELTGMTWEEAGDYVPAVRGKVLVMDDEEIIRDLLMDTLTSIGYEVTAVADGAETITLYKEAKESGNAFDAVIIDLTIPGGMGGKETVQKLMEIDSEVKAIVSSGYSRDPIMANYERYGFKGVVAKPYDPRELGELLHRLIHENA